MWQYIITFAIDSKKPTSPPNPRDKQKTYTTSYNLINHAMMNFLCKRLTRVAAVAAIMMMPMQHAAAGNITSLVDPMIGSGGHGHVFVGANVPFGMVQLGPTEITRGWDWCSGYHYSDNELIGFGHTHMSGTGIGEMGDIALLPVADKNQKHIIFSHDNEKVRPGYYSLRATNPDVQIELTATKRVGFHRYTFAQGQKQCLVSIDLAQGIGWDTMTDCLLTQESPTLITGMRRSAGWSKDHRYYFAMQFSSPVTIVSRDSLTHTVVQAETGGKPLLVKVALSPIDIMGAKANMQAELPGWDFDATAAAADKAWDEQLSRITISGGSDSQRRVFYTAMYHFMIAPSLFCDVNGDYRGSDGRVRHANYTNYGTFSLWDAYRAAYPLMTVICPDMQKDLATTFINIYKEQGKLPIWHLAGWETDCMVGSSGVPILADLVLKGFVSDKETAFEALKASMLYTDRSLPLLKEYGYIPWDKEPSNETVAKALEYCLDDAGVAKVAKLLGKTDDYNYFYNRSQSYKKYFDPATRFMRAVGTDGTFRTPFDPFDASHRTNDYTEGNAWQYTFLVPHDVHGLVNLFGGDKQFQTKLDSLFIVEGTLGDNASPDVSGLVGQYAQGNEPSHHVIYMYNFIGKPYKAAPLLRRMMSEMYGTGVDGLSGNEDVGQMSAWYILSSVGLYQVDPSGGRFIIGSPIFNEAKLNVGNGKTFTVRAVNNSDKNMYVQSARLNGRAYTKSYIDYADIKAGSTLVLTMGPKPSKWGTAAKDRP